MNTNIMLDQITLSYKYSDKKSYKGKTLVETFIDEPTLRSIFKFQRPKLFATRVVDTDPPS